MLQNLPGPLRHNQAEVARPDKELGANNSSAENMTRANISVASRENSPIKQAKNESLRELRRHVSSIAGRENYGLANACEYNRHNLLRR